MSNDFFFFFFGGGGYQRPEKNSVETEFSTCKPGMDRMNLTSFVQSLYLQREKLLQTQNCNVLFRCLCFVSTPHAQWFVRQNLYFLAN